MMQLMLAITLISPAAQLPIPATAMVITTLAMLTETVMMMMMINSPDNLQREMFTQKRDFPHQLSYHALPSTPRTSVHAHDALHTSHPHTDRLQPERKREGDSLVMHSRGTPLSRALMRTNHHRLRTQDNEKTSTTWTGHYHPLAHKP